MTVTDTETGCTTTDDIYLKFFNVICDEPFIYLPNAFTPFNGDEKNDILFVRGNNIKEMDFYIYDRWGREGVVRVAQPSRRLERQAQGQGATLDAYGFLLKVTCTDNSTYKKQGNVTILRWRGEERPAAPARSFDG